MVKSSLLLPILLLLLAPIACYARTVTVRTKGQLLCDGKPYQNERIQMWEYNRIFRDDKWNEAATTKNGSFVMEVTIDKDYWFNPVPYLWIPNYCGATPQHEGCTVNIIRIDVPKENIIDGFKSDKVFDLGSFELLDYEKTDLHGLGVIFSRYEFECKNH